MPESLTRFLASAPGDATAVLDHDRSMTYAELDDLARRAAAGLARLGVCSGDRVALWLPNTPVWLVLFFACARLGAIAVSVNTRFRSHEVADIVGRAGCKVLAFWPGFRDIDFAGCLASIDAAALRSLTHLVAYRPADQDTAPARLPGVETVTYAALAGGRSDPGETAGAAARCVIFTTSGTTRAPKFVCHAQAGVTRHARDVAQAFGFAAADTVVLQALPLCGVFGFTLAMAAIAAGRPLVLLPVFTAAAAVDAMQARRVTHACGSDEMIARMLALAPEPRPFPYLRWFGYASFNPELGDTVEHAETRGVVLRGLYGMSEVQAFYAAQPLDAPLGERRKGGGRPVAPAARVRVRDPDTGAVLAAGVAGEIEIQGPSLMVEYFNDPAATAAAFTADGFFRTGDLGYLEEDDGRFCYVTRMGDVLRLAGFLTSPGEIEAVIETHPAVAASQVVGVGIEGQPAAVAFVIAREGTVIAEHDLAEFCRHRLAAYKVPRRFFALAEFPTTPSANGTKIQRARLREMARTRVGEA